MTSKSDPRGHPGLKLCVHVSVMAYYRFINFHQNRRGSGIFLGDFTWNDQSMKWTELKRSSPVQIHGSLILIQSNPADDPEPESSPVQSGHNRVGIYQIPRKMYVHVITNEDVFS